MTNGQNSLQLSGGVTQGSVQGSLMFLIFINEVPLSLSVISKTILNADDITFLNTSEDMGELL